eukprot:1633399-Rhodomonas_salina.2
MAYVDTSRERGCHAVFCSQGGELMCAHVVAAAARDARRAVRCQVRDPARALLRAPRHRPSRRRRQPVTPSPSFPARCTLPQRVSGGRRCLGVELEVFSAFKMVLMHPL